MGARNQEKVSRIWSRNLSYAIGLITADGNLHPDGRHIQFVSAEQEMVENLRTALGINNRIGRAARGGEKVKKYYTISFGDKVFYHFLISIGLSPAKSKTIHSVDVPERFFADFLRGLFDGDGTFYTFQDRRWPRSFGYQISFASASHRFILWLQERLRHLYGVKGFVRLGDGVYNLRYVKGDTRIIAAVMYASQKCLHLRRKYFKLHSAFKYDSLLHSNMPR